jgi:hypothetical protein
MPYKVYTYLDPYKIDQTDFWNEIKDLPHLCASRTLVNGLASVLPEQIGGLLCPIDEILSFPEIYGRWKDNISLRIQQYGYLTKAFDSLHNSGKIDENFYLALGHNKNQMLDALRLFVELGINASSLHREQANKEQRLFISLLEAIQEKQAEPFRFPDGFDLDSVKTVFSKKSTDELTDLENNYAATNTEVSPTKRAWMNRIIENTSHWNGKAIVIHGIHQFSPIQLRFIVTMEKMGVTVIFLHNYQPEFHEMYSSWNYIYQYFNADVHQDTNITSYITPGQLDNPGHALACTMGLLCNDSVDRSNPIFKKYYDLYKSLQVIQFDNVTEYAGFISNKFDIAREKLAEEGLLASQPFRKQNNTLALRRMDELVYTANKDVDELLQVYYPEYSKSRHFLAYPIGQFFAALYQLWDWEKGQIKIDFSLIRDCVNSGLVGKCTAEELLKSTINLEVMFENCSYCDDFHYRIMEQYLPQYDLIQKALPGSTAYSLKCMSIYHPYKVSRDDILHLMGAIEEINEIAKTLFQADASDETYLEFGTHFQRLEQFIRSKQTALASEEEKDLISQLLVRFDDIHLSSSNMKGTFEDLRNGLYFFLKQKEVEDTDWIVKNFEQIDGDVLRSKSQNRPGSEKCYHFACVSDRDMNQSVNQLLPWPLTAQFIERSYTPIDLQFQVYYATLNERSNFMRYALFYGLYFNQCQTRLSFVRRYGDEVTEVYDPLRLVGIECVPDAVTSTLESHSMLSQMAPQSVTKLNYDRAQMMTMFLCPYRYLNDYVLNPLPLVTGDFLCAQLFENVLVANVWHALSNMNNDMAARKFSTCIRTETNKLRPYFPFWKESDFPDLIKKAETYFVNKIGARSRATGSTIQVYSESHMKMRQDFGVAKYYIDPSEQEPKNPYQAFEALSAWEDGKKVYSLHKVPKSAAAALTHDTLDYLNLSTEPIAIASDWCTYCNNKGMCLVSYQLE